MRQVSPSDCSRCCASSLASEKESVSFFFSANLHSTKRNRNRNRLLSSSSSRDCWASNSKRGRLPSALLRLVLLIVAVAVVACVSRSEIGQVGIAQFAGARCRARMGDVSIDNERSKVNADTTAAAADSFSQDPIRISYRLVEQGTHHGRAFRKYQAVVVLEEPKSQVVVSFAMWAKGLSSLSDNADELTRIIVSNSNDNSWAIFWETPPVSYESMHTTSFEFVLVDAPELAAFTKDRGVDDASAFDDQFRKCRRSSPPESNCCVFSNLGRDAVLISPLPAPKTKTTGNDSSTRIHSHLMAYLRTVPMSETARFWKQVAEPMMTTLLEHQHQQLNHSPPLLWLSTSGMGVAYVHVRIDRRPKYYTFTPYTTI